ncbi:MAG: HD domain-containing protein [Candidatus Dojkabacteria bacterium]
MTEITKENFLKLIPKYVIDLGESLQKNNFEAFLVGGSIRDIFLNKTPQDFDIATNATPEEIIKIFPKSIPTGAKFGTITVVTQDESGESFDVQITTYRSEADYVGGRWPSKVEFSKTIDEDLSRRDFTINAMALNIQKFDEELIDIRTIIIDPFYGLRDLDQKLIKAVRDPIERLSEDGLRAVRACRLASQLEFTIDPQTFEAIKRTNHITKLISVERFREEFMKILLKSSKPSVGIRLLADAGILEIFIPELLEGRNVVQPQFHTDDVFEHSLKACDIAEDSIKVSALFHDIGKPRTQTEDEKGIHFYGHDVVSAEMTEDIMKRLKFSNNEIDRVVKLVRWHMFYYPSADWRKTNDESSYAKASEDKLGWTDGAIRRLVQNVGGVDAINDLMKLRIADAESNPKNGFNPKELDELSERVSSVISKEMALKVTDLDINGEDLVSNFGLERGPEVGKILKYLLDKVVDEPLLNKKEDLLKLAKEYLANEGMKE